MAGELAVFLSAGAIETGDLTGDVTTSGGTAATLAGGDLNVLDLSGQNIQCFNIHIINSAGTLQHRICASPNDTGVLPTYSNKITGASVTLANTPTVSAGVDFTNGVGITSNRIVLNTAAQTIASLVGLASTTYYDGNVARPRARVEFTSRDVNGTTRIRMEIVINLDMDGTAWTINTTNLPAGKAIFVQFFGFLA